ncbi:hypothetical protein R1flu_017635 [Riccia fluitans]|uniref:Secreted protein n=1 Tax=Riccia fluitans TaxID=41844 RepID=A0ABD1ZEK2_9MARC
MEALCCRLVILLPCLAAARTLHISPDSGKSNGFMNRQEKMATRCQEGVPKRNTPSTLLQEGACKQRLAQRSFCIKYCPEMMEKPA